MRACRWNDVSMVSRVAAFDPTNERRGTMRSRIAPESAPSWAAGASGAFARAMRSAADCWSAA